MASPARPRTTLSGTSTAPDRLEQVRRPYHLDQPPLHRHQVCGTSSAKNEVLTHVEDVALGHTTKLRWNDDGTWLRSNKIVQPPIIDRDDFDRVQALVAGRAHAPAAHKPHRARRPYALRACVWCGVCDQRMQGHWCLVTGAASRPSTRSPTASSTR